MYYTGSQKYGSFSYEASKSVLTGTGGGLKPQRVASVALITISETALIANTRDNRYIPAIFCHLERHSRIKIRAHHALSTDKICGNRETTRVPNPSRYRDCHGDQVCAHVWLHFDIETI